MIQRLSRGTTAVFLTMSMSSWGACSGDSSPQAPQASKTPQAAAAAGSGAAAEASPYPNAQAQQPGDQQLVSAQERDQALAAIPEAMRPAELLGGLMSKLLKREPGERGIAMFSEIMTVEAGADTTFCTYVPGVTEGVTHIHDTLGVQSAFGHHAIMQYSTSPQEPGTRPCDPESLEAQQGQILGGTGGEGTGAIVLPDNVVSEIPPGSQFIINHHWINSSDSPIQVQAEMVTVPPPSEDGLIIARALVVTTTAFDLPAKQMTETSVTCAFDHEVSMISLLGHQHSWGAHVKAERLGAAADVIFDHDYDQSMVSHPVTTNYATAAPYHFAAGDSVRMTCQWLNTTDNDLMFPREMCVMFGWQIGSDRDITCVDGHWL